MCDSFVADLQTTCSTTQATGPDVLWALERTPFRLHMCSSECSYRQCAGRDEERPEPDGQQEEHGEHQDVKVRRKPEPPAAQPGLLPHRARVSANCCSEHIKVSLMKQPSPNGESG